jgi:mycobactin lysine-N-oxygenase
MAKKICIVGAGPKAMAIAAKARVLRDLKISDLTALIVEKSDLAANWDGRHGFTDGEQELGTPPEKDIGFPYESIFGKKVDARLWDLSWPRYKVENGEYGNWVDKGRPQPRHGGWGRYLCWVCERAQPDIIHGTVKEIRAVDGGVSFTVAEGSRERSVECSGIVLTGPGEALKISDNFSDDSGLVLDGKTYWQNIPTFVGLAIGRIAVIGGGETAASVVLSLLRNTSSKVRVDLINRHGTIYTRGESYYENRLFTYAGSWADLDDDQKREFIQRTDRGVFSVAAKQEIDQSSRVHTIVGSVLGIGIEGGVVNVRALFRGSEYIWKYDRVIVATGFDPFTGLGLISEDFRPTLPFSASVRQRLLRSIDSNLRIKISKDSEAEGSVINVHVPMLAGIAQGPGFPNLSCLGAVSDRVLGAYIATP